MAVEEWQAFLHEPLEKKGKKLLLIRSGRMRPLGQITAFQRKAVDQLITLVYGPATHLTVDISATQLTEVADGWYEFRHNGVEYLIQREL